jgi:plasmid stability protein
VCAAEHGRSTEAESRDILEKAAKPEGRIELGSHLTAIGWEARFTDEDVDAIRRHRGQTNLVPLTFE